MLSMRAVAMLANCLFVAFGAGCGRSTSAAAGVPQFDTPYQAVLLDTGLVYYGKISGLDTAYPVLRDVYYIQQSTDPQSK